VGSSTANHVYNEAGGVISGGASATFAVDLGAGNDTLHGQVGQVVGVVFGGLGNDTLLGGMGADNFQGGANNDLLHGGGGGADVLDGGDGNDRFDLGAQASGSFTLTDSSGLDTILSTIERNLLSYNTIESLTLQGMANVNGIGNALGNSLVGNGGNNLLAGQGGNDILNGLGGTDNLFGQAGQDVLTGGAGNDMFSYQVAAHSLNVATGDIINDFDDSGDDRINLGAVYGPALGFIGTTAFTAAGQVRINDIAGANLVVELNLDGNTATAEMQILLVNTTVAQVAADDFVLV
jgi:Ca2+-binding RTX toxin-like protein